MLAQMLTALCMCIEVSYDLNRVVVGAGSTAAGDFDNANLLSVKAASSYASSKPPASLRCASTHASNPLRRPGWKYQNNQCCASSLVFFLLNNMRL